MFLNYRSKFLKLLTFSSLFLLFGCSPPKVLFYKSGLTIEEFKRDKYDCAQQARTSWSGGGTGNLGLAMIASAKSEADKQSKSLFRMCMEARGYTAREVSDEEFTRQTSPFNRKMQQLTKKRLDRCNDGKFMLLFKKAACKIDDITLDQLEDKTTILESEKQYFKNYIYYVNKINTKTIELIQNDGNDKDKKIGLLLDKLYQQSDKIALDLYEEKITWGEYNKNRKKLHQVFKEDEKHILNTK